MDGLRAGASMDEIDEELELVEVMINSLDSDDEDYEVKKLPLEQKYEAMLAMRESGTTTSALADADSNGDMLSSSSFVRQSREASHLSDSFLDDVLISPPARPVKRSASTLFPEVAPNTFKSRRIDSTPESVLEGETRGESTQPRRRVRSVKPDRLAMHLRREEQINLERQDRVLAQKMQAEADSMLPTFNGQLSSAQRPSPQSGLGRDAVFDRQPSTSAHRSHAAGIPPAITSIQHTSSPATVAQRPVVSPFSISRAYPDLITTEAIDASTLSTTMKQNVRAIVHRARATLRSQPVGHPSHASAVRTLQHQARFLKEFTPEYRTDPHPGDQTSARQSPANTLKSGNVSQTPDVSVAAARNPTTTNPPLRDCTEDDDDIQILSSRYLHPNRGSSALSPNIPHLISIDQRSTLRPTSRDPVYSNVPQLGYAAPVNGSVYGYPYGLYARDGIAPVAGPSSVHAGMQLFNGASQVAKGAMPHWVDALRQMPGSGLVFENGYDDYEDEYKRRGWDAVLHDPKQTEEDLKKLLENIRPDEDLPPEMRLGTPTSMKVTLMPHQVLGLTWLKKQEEGNNKGSVLADDMGLGKTIQALALMVSRPSEDRSVKTTLIVAPVALMRQWANEIADRLKSRYGLSLYTYHGQKKKASYATLANYDVVLTTYGTIASEYRLKDDFELRKRANPDAVMLRKLVLLDDNSKWYRVILDEAQYIKNKSTLSSRGASCLNATHRLCMTGTPMMNNVGELYSLIRFLRISPYNNWDRFNADFSRPLSGAASDGEKEKAMKALQVLMKSILLRRTKKSLIDGQPILSLPERTTEVQHSVFSQDEAEFYTSLETQSQLKFNKYLKAGTVGKNYAFILVLLLRLRQCCCHPHLVKNHAVEGNTGVPEEDMTAIANALSANVVSMIKETNGAFECPVCYDAVENPTIFFPCGHDVCSECFTRMQDPAQAIAHGSDSVELKCPECRAQVLPNKVIDYTTFRKVHMPEQAPAEVKPDSVLNTDFEDNSDNSDDSDSDIDSHGDLRDFVVPDGAEEDIDETASEGNGGETEANETAKSKKSNYRSKRKGKGRAKPKADDTMKLAQLKKEGQKNAKAKKRYLRRLRRDWISSSKIDKTLELLRNIRENDDKEKTIIFSQFTSLLDLLELGIDNEGWNFRRYDGSMSPALRNAAVEDFTKQAGVMVMLVSLKAGNAGLNLTAASQVIILDPFWNPYIVGYHRLCFLARLTTVYRRSRPSIVLTA